MIDAAGLLLASLPDGATVSGLGPGGLLEIGERAIVVGHADDCDVVVSGVAIGAHSCRLSSQLPRVEPAPAPRGRLTRAWARLRPPPAAPPAPARVWIFEHLGDRLPVQVGDELVSAGRRVLRQGDLVILRNARGTGPFFVFVRFEAARRRACVWPRVEAALSAERALRDEVQRWFSSEVLPPPGGLVALEECAFCGATGAGAARTVLYPATFDFVADVPRRPPASLVLCRDCVAEPIAERAARAARAPALRDQARAALAAAGDAAAADELERRFARAAPRVTPALCAFCGAPRDQALVGASGQAVCAACLEAAKQRWG